MADGFAFRLEVHHQLQLHRPINRVGARRFLRGKFGSDVERHRRATLQENLVRWFLYGRHVETQPETDLELWASLRTLLPHDGPDWSHTPFRSRSHGKRH